MNNLFIKNLLQAIEKGLPGENSHAKMAPLNRPLSSYAIKTADTVKESSVAIILYEKENQFHSILIQRPEYEGSHSGQISFPGGKKDLSDIDLEFTARRETFEEIGIPTTEGHLIGELTEVFIPVSGFLVKPFIYYHIALPELIPDQREVAEIVRFSINELLEDSSISSMEITFPTGIIQKNIPCFNLANKQVWGATALILNEFRDILFKFHS